MLKFKTPKKLFASAASVTMATMLMTGCASNNQVEQPAKPNPSSSQTSQADKANKKIVKDADFLANSLAYVHAQYIKQIVDYTLLNLENGYQPERDLSKEVVAKVLAPAVEASDRHDNSEAENTEIDDIYYGALSKELRKLSSIQFETTGQTNYLDAIKSQDSFLYKLVAAYKQTENNTLNLNDALELQAKFQKDNAEQTNGKTVLKAVFTSRKKFIDFVKNNINSSPNAKEQFFRDHGVQLVERHMDAMLQLGENKNLAELYANNTTKMPIPGNFIHSKIDDIFLCAVAGINKIEGLKMGERNQEKSEFFIEVDNGKKGSRNQKSSHFITPAKGRCNASEQNNGIRYVCSALNNSAQGHVTYGEKSTAIYTATPTANNSGKVSTRTGIYLSNTLPGTLHKLACQ